MHIFYSNCLEDNVFILDEAESIHLSRVLRLSTGDKVNVIDGSGSFYHCSVVDSNKKQAKLEVENVIRDFERRSYYLHIAIAPTKNIDSFELFIEKSVGMRI